MSSLASERCLGDIGEDARLDPHDIKKIQSELPSGWEIIENHHLFRSFSFDDFRSALDFVDRIGSIAEDEQHHPDIGLSYGKVDVRILTHKVGGLTRNDFILAAKIEREKKPKPG